MTLWKSRCENYFEMYEVDANIWVKVATMHFEGVATRWLQSIEHRVRTATWTELDSLMANFVQDYIDKFCELVDQLQAYSSNVEPLYYTTRFIDGLHGDINHLIIVHRPKDLDTACYLALLQEETSNPHHKEARR
jgi:hypothetical protein